MPDSKPRIAIYVTDADLPMMRALTSNGFKLSTIAKHLLWKFAVEQGLIEKPIDNGEGHGTE